MVLLVQAELNGTPNPFVMKKAKLLFALLGLVFILVFGVFDSPFIPPFITQQKLGKELTQATPADCEKLCLSNKASTIQSGTARLHIPAGSLPIDKVIKMSTLYKADLPQLSEDLVNVTRNQGGVRCLPHGTHFLKPATLFLTIDTALIPNSYSIEDVRTYYFDELAKRWMVIPKDTLLTASSQLGSLTTHFTDFITGILVSPDMPENDPYLKTKFKDWVTVKPTERIRELGVPGANSYGSLSTSLSLKLPPGRKGMEPSLNLVYNSNTRHSPLGSGFEIPIPYIGIDTRWGVPRYNDQHETETYTLNQEQLYPTVHRDKLQARSAEKRFSPRVEGNFQRIIRHGDHPKNYWWEVKSKDGVTQYYGGTPSDGGVFQGAILRDEYGNIGHWGLREEQDSRGNFVRYHYALTQNTGLPRGKVPGQELYLDRITYTGHGNTKGLFSVQFIRESGRKDVSIDCTLGFKRVRADLIRRIEIRYQQETVTSYEFNYQQGAFFKTLLSEVVEKDRAGNVFTQHRFEYYDDVRQNGQYAPFANKVDKISTHTGDLKGPLVSSNLGINNGASPISSAKSSSFGVGASNTVGPNGSSICKNLSVGGNYGINGASTDGLTALVDIDGDGLPDEVFRENGVLKFHPNISKPGGAFAFSNEAKSIMGVTQFSTSRTRGNSKGVEANFSFFFVGHTWTKSQTITDTYFADFNADQLIDIVHKGRVYFNHRDSLGNILFSTSSKGTPNPIVASGAPIDPTLYVLSKEAIDSLIDENPLHDMVRIWEAPYSGWVKIDAPVELIDDQSPEATDYKQEDGVRVAIQLRDKEIWADTLKIREAGLSFSPNIGVDSFKVEKGDRIYFRVQSIEDGAFDHVHWDTGIHYVHFKGPERDPNGQNPAQYQASRDFILSAPQAIGLPIKGKIKVEGIFSKSITSDNVQVGVLKKSASGKIDTLIFNDLAWQDKIEKEISGEFEVDSLDEVSFKVISSTNIDWTGIQWKPSLYYTQFSNGMPTEVDGKKFLAFPATPDFSMFNRMLTPPLLWVAPQTGVVNIQAFPLGPSRKPVGKVTLSAKGVNKLYGKTSFAFTNSNLFPVGDANFSIQVKGGDSIWLEYHIQNDTLLEMLQKDIINPSSTGLPVSINGRWYTAGVFTRPKLPWLGPQYRGWGFIAYNGNRNRASEPIHEKELTISPLVDPGEASALPKKDAEIPEHYNPVKANFVALYPDCETQSWRGFDDLCWVGRSQISSSRFGEDSMRPDLGTPADTGSVAPNKMILFKSKNIAVGQAAGFIGASSTTSFGNTIILYLVLDMNNDGFPDFISPQKIQYTTSMGGLEERAVEHQFGNQRGSSEQVNVSLGGGIGPAKENKETEPAQASNCAKQSTDAGKTASTAIGLNAGLGGGTEESIESWLDLNGDGLPDKVYHDGMVALNLGYRFSAKEDWGFEGIQEGKSTDLAIGGSLGLNYHQGSIVAGVGLSKTTSGATLVLQDLTADELVDMVFINDTTGQMFVKINLGNGFSEAIEWVGPESIDESESIGESINGAFTICINFFFFRICFNPSGYKGQSISRQTSQFISLDGDKQPEFVTFKDGEMRVRASNLGRTNLLKSVVRPLGSSYVVDYIRSSNSFDNPMITWLLSSLEINDGVPGDGENQKLVFEYSNPYYDRQERTFYGFKRVITQRIDLQNQAAIHSTLAQEFANNNYYTRGFLLTDTLYEGKLGRKFLVKHQTWSLKDVKTGEAFQTKQFPEAGGQAFPALTQSQTYFYEGQTESEMTTSTQYRYDHYGNVSSYFEQGDGSPEDTVRAIIQYHHDDQQYLHNIPSAIRVFVKGGEIRRRESTIDTRGNVIQIKKYLKNGTAAVSDFTFDSYGNITRMTLPPNHRNQGLWYSYTYDSQVHSYVVKVEDAYGYSSQNQYDYRFGVLLEERDINNQKTSYVLDDVGRIKTVTGPNERDKTYTLAFDYYPNASIPYTKTRQFDPVHKQDIVTITYMDGLQRVIQVKKTGSIFVGNGQADQVRMIATGRLKFDALGRACEKYYPMVDDTEQFNPIFNATPATKTQFDILDRPLKITLPDGTKTSYTYGFGVDNYGYQAFKTRITYPKGNSKELYQDIRNRQRAIKEEGGPDGEIWTGFRYNALSELTSSIDHKKNVTTYVYNNFGQVISEHHPDAGLREYTYDLAGMKISELTPVLRKQYGDTTRIKYTYDFNHLIRIDYPKSFQNQVIFHYGTAADTLHRRVGRMYLQEDASGGEEYFFDNLGEIKKTIRTILVNKSTQLTWVWEATHDSWNRVLQMIYPDGEVVNYGYNRAGQVNRLSGQKGGKSYVYLEQMGYDEFDQRVFCKLGNNTITRYSYEPLRRRLSKLEVLSTQGSRVIMRNHYSYDENDNIVEIHNTAPLKLFKLGGPSHYRFEYDNLNRLQQAEGDYTGLSHTDVFDLQLEYDNLHNIVRKKQRHLRNDKTYTANTYDLEFNYQTQQPHAPNKIGRRLYTHDANGNNLGWRSEHLFGWRQILWDEADRIAVISDNGLLNFNTYDAKGIRVIKSSGGIQAVKLNGTPTGYLSHQKNWTVFVSPYLVAKEGGFTKHYFIEGQRIASKVGNGYFTNDYYFQKGLTAGGLDYQKKMNLIQSARTAYLRSKGLEDDALTPPFVVQGDSYSKNPDWVLVAGKPRDTATHKTPGPPSPLPDTLTNSKVRAGYQYKPASSTGNVEETNRHFFHPNHLGSTSYVTDRYGEVQQHLEYLPFGELFVDETSTSGKLSDFLFTGKFYDAETGLYCFDARYYDPLTSMWMSADPLRGKYPGWSPYNYTMLNPVKYVDPEGKEPITFMTLATAFVLGAGAEAYAQLAEMAFTRFQDVDQHNFSTSANKIAFNGALNAATLGAEKYLQPSKVAAKIAFSTAEFSADVLGNTFIEEGKLESKTVLENAISAVPSMVAGKLSGDAKIGSNGKIYLPKPNGKVLPGNQYDLAPISELAAGIATDFVKNAIGTSSKSPSSTPIIPETGFKGIDYPCIGHHTRPKESGQSYYQRKPKGKY